MSAEAKRGCGYRKIGGIYLCSDGPGEACHRLPVPLSVCPTCKHGIKQSRGWTWLDWVELAGGCCDPATRKGLHCAVCVVCTPTNVGRDAEAERRQHKEIWNQVGLLWIGERFYKTPAEFTGEAMRMGVSRRLSALPRNFKIGETFVFIAHPKALAPAPMTKLVSEVIEHEEESRAGIFHAFLPSRVEKILADDEDPAVVEQWKARGYTVVQLPANDKDHRGSVFDDEEE